jgi:hypothetical protein
VPRRISLSFAAGVVGAMASTLCLWAAGVYGLSASAGVHLSPGLGAGWLYFRLVWGGLWGLLFLLPLRTKGPVATGLVLSLVPTVADLLWFMPRAGGGLLGLHHGVLTPVFVLAANAVWGIAAGLWWRASGGK